MSQKVTKLIWLESGRLYMLYLYVREVSGLTIHEGEKAHEREVISQGDGAWNGTW